MASEDSARLDRLEMSHAFLEDRVEQLEAALRDKEAALAAAEEDLAVLKQAVSRLAGRTAKSATEER